VCVSETTENDGIVVVGRRVILLGWHPLHYKRATTSRSCLHAKIQTRLDFYIVYCIFSIN